MKILINKHCTFWVIVAFAGIVLLAACSNGNDPSDPNTYRPTTGSLYGSFIARDGYNNLVSDLSGVEVTVISSDGVTYKTLTLAEGSWEIDSLPANIYSIFVQSPIYAKVLRPLADNVQFIGVGRFKVSHYNRLRADIRDDIIHSASIDVIAQLPPDPPIQHQNDTSIVLTLRFMSRNNDSTSGGIIEVSRTSIMTCADGLRLGLSWELDGQYGRKLTIDKSNLQAVLGKDIKIGQTLYFAIRAVSSRLNDSTQKEEPVCHEPLLLQVTL